MTNSDNKNQLRPNLLCFVADICDKVACEAEDPDDHFKIGNSVNPADARANAAYLRNLANDYASAEQSTKKEQYNRPACCNFRAY